MRDLFVFWDSSLVVLGVFLTRLACYNKIVEKTRAEICLQTTTIKTELFVYKKKNNTPHKMLYCCLQTNSALSSNAFF